MSYKTQTPLHGFVVLQIHNNQQSTTNPCSGVWV